MALYHFHVTQVKRTEGRSAVASAAYRAGEKITNLWDGETHDYTQKGGVVCTEVLLPSNAPKRFYARATLWNDLELYEKRSDAQLAYSFDASLQNEFTLEENIEYAKQFVREQFLAKGMIVDFAFHLPDKEDGGIPNPHFHVLAPIRPLNADGTWGAKQHRVYHLNENEQRIRKKNGEWSYDAVPTTDWGRPETLEAWREEWAKFINSKFEEKGLDCRIDHHSYENQGLDLLPTVHEGPHVRKMEKRGIRTEKGDLNRWIRSFNKMIGNLKATILALKESIQELKAELDKPQEVMLGDLLSQAWTSRNEVAATYSRGIKKAKKKNRDRFMEEVNYLREHQIYTLSDFERHISSMESQIDTSNTTMKSKQGRMKELRSLIDMVAEYKTLKPVVDEMKKDKYRFKKAKKNYQSEHQAELTRFYMVRRKLKEAGYEKASFPITTWEKELEKISGEYSGILEQYKGMRRELNTMYQIKGDIDTVLRETGMNTQKNRKQQQTEAVL